MGNLDISHRIDAIMQSVSACICTAAALLGCMVIRYMLEDVYPDMMRWCGTVVGCAAWCLLWWVCHAVVRHLVETRVQRDR